MEMLEPAHRENIHKTWISVLVTMKDYEGISSRDYAAWLNNIHPESFDNHTAVLQVPNIFAEQWIRGHYAHHIQHALREVTGISNIAYHINEKLPENGFLPDLSIIGIVQEHQPEEKESSYSQKSPKPPEPAYKTDSQLTIDTFVKAEHNRLAYAAAEELISSRRPQFQTLYLFSEEHGSGLTHLLSATTNATEGSIYITAEDFLATWQNALQGTYGEKTHKTGRFRDQFRTTSLLAVDDLENIRGVNTSQELTQTVESIVRSQGRVLVASHRTLDELSAKIPPKLTNILRRGMVAEIKQPDLDSRISVLKELTERLGYIPNQGMIIQIAKSELTIPGMIGSLHNVNLYTKEHSLGLVPNEEQTKQILKGEIPKGSKPLLTPPIIGEAVAEAVDQHLNIFFHQILLLRNV